MATVDRRPYASSGVLNQSVLDESMDNLTISLEMIAELEGPAGTIYLSDVAKYVDSTYYAPRVIFPVVNRTVGDWLSGELEFSDLEILVNNADGAYSDVLPGGANYDGWIGRRLTIKLGLGEVGTTYIQIFTGVITDVGGFSRNTTTFRVQARSDFELANVQLPDQLLIPDDWPNIEDDFVGLGAPIIYGDWTTNLRPEAPEIPAFPVNGADANVLAGTADVRCVVSSSPIKSLDTTSVVLFRGDAYYAIPAVDVAIVGATNNQVIDISQQGFNIDGSPWIYEVGDQFFLKCVGVDLGAYDGNIVEQARDILTRFTPIAPGDFDITWNYFRDKAAPAQSAIANIVSRVWFQESVNAVEQIASMLEQVRLEPFINRDNKFSLTSLHFDEFDPSPSYSVKNWDVVGGQGGTTFEPSIDDRNNWNRAKGDYRFSPPAGQNSRSTGLYRNNAAISQAGRAISKLVTFPNLVIESDVVNQLTEMIRLASGYAEMVDVTLTPRAFLRDIGDFINIDVNIGAVEFGYEDVVGIIRAIGYDPKGRSIIAKIWSLQMVNFPGYAGPTGTVGGYDATIIKET